MLTAKIKKLNSKAKIPTKGSEKAAGYDLYACVNNDVLIGPHETVKIGTGIAVTPPEGYFGAIFARSGLAIKNGLAPANKVGVCDEDYTGEYIVALHNHSDDCLWVSNGMRIAQLVFLPYIDVNFELTTELEETERGAGGFGSTGV